LDNLLTGLISSKTRIKLLIRFFFNPQTKSYLRELAKDFGVSTNAVREELNQLTKTGLLTQTKNGRHVYYQANTGHPLFPELSSMVGKVIGVDQVIEGILRRLGKVECSYLLGDYAEGKDSGIIDILLVGDIDPRQLNDLTTKTERYIRRKIRSLVMTFEEYQEFAKRMESLPHVVIWKSKDLKPHPVHTTK
jgi:PaaX-like protein